MKSVTLVSSACWSPDGSWLVLGRPLGRVEIYAVPSGSLLNRIETGEPVSALAFEPGGAWLAIGGAALRLWDCRQSVLARGIAAHPAAIQALTFNSRGDRLATTCADRTVRVFAVPPSREAGGSTTLRPLFDPVPHLSERKDGVAPPAFVSGGRALLTISGKRALMVRDANTGQPVGPGPIATEFDPLRDIAASDDGSVFAAAGSLAAPFGPQLWIVRDGVTTSRRLEHRNYVKALSISRDNSVLLTASWDGTAKLWSLPSGTLQGNPLVHQGLVERAVFSPGGRFVATAQSDGLVRVWARPTGRLSDRKIPGSNVAVLSPDGRHVVASRFSFIGTGAGGRSVRVYDVASGRPAGPPLALGGALRNAALSPTATLVGVGYEDEKGGGLAVFDFASGKPRFEPRTLPRPPEALAFSPDGTTLAAYSIGGPVLLIDPANGTETLRLPFDDAGHRFFPAHRRALFTHDGSCLVILGGNMRVRAYDLTLARSNLASTRGTAGRRHCPLPRRPLPGDRYLLPFGYRPCARRLGPAQWTCRGAVDEACRRDLRRRFQPRRQADPDGRP